MSKSENKEIPFNPKITKCVLHQTYTDDKTPKQKYEIIFCMIGMKGQYAHNVQIKTKNLIKEYIRNNLNEMIFSENFDLLDTEFKPKNDIRSQIRNYDSIVFFGHYMTMGDGAMNIYDDSRVKVIISV